MTLVANQSMRTPKSEFIDTLLVPSGMNVADRRIIELVEPGDLVVTADVPLAAEVVARGGEALDMLKAMKRQITRAEMDDLVAAIREKVPGICLRTTLIAGFPGETRDDVEVVPTREGG